MKNRLLIIGASGHGKVVANIAKKMKRWETIAFLDDNKSALQSIGIEVIGTTKEAYNYLDQSDIFIGIGNNLVRKKIHEELTTAGASIPILIHPKAVIEEEVEIGRGTVVMPGVVINCCTRIGESCIINTGSTIDHDNSIADYVHVSPGTHLAGTVNVGKESWIGIGSIISNNINIASSTIIGAGAVVVKDIKKSGTYIGVPARRI